MSKSKKVPEAPPRFNKTANAILLAGILFLAAGLLILLAVYRTVIVQELSYRLFPPDQNEVKIIRPVAEDYGIVIPKIGANARIIAGVSPYNEKEYQVQLAKGVAQARNTASPGQYGNTFIFAHSAGNLNLANRYNAVFYLLNKMVKNDPIYIFFKGKKYLYRVTDTKVVSADALEYLKQENTRKELTLMTCWPPGTTFRRLVVRAELSSAGKTSP